MAPLVRAADFERALGTPPRAKTARFSLHYAPVAEEHAAGKLSTGDAPASSASVDDPARLASRGQRLGVVVPKRLARRAVTRHLVKRLVRVAVAARAALLAPGIWVVRLRAPIDLTTFHSAASEALRRSLGLELADLLARAPAR